MMLQDWTWLKTSTLVLVAGGDHANNLLLQLGEQYEHMY